jgi:hypothetical protein
MQTACAVMLTDADGIVTYIKSCLHQLTGHTLKMWLENTQGLWLLMIRLLSNTSVYVVPYSQGVCLK